MKELVATKNASFACSALISRIRFLPESSNQRCLLSFKANQQQRNIGTQVVQVKCYWKSQNAAVRNDVEAIGVPTSVPVRVAHELVQAGHRYLDVRTPEEFSAGHAAAAVNVPYMYRVGSGMTKNPHFIAEVSQHFKKDNEIIVGCQSGKRSMMAATDLVAAGFTGITDIAGGYDAWTQNSLPTEF